MKLSDKSDTCCKSCKRVWYCSKECRRQDAEAVSLSEEDQTQGHSSIICALLRLCQVDDQVEDSVDREKIAITEEEKEAAKDRITSEYESYPATLGNVLMDASCFQPTLSRMKMQRRGKTERQSDLANIQQQSKKTFTVHIIGASEEAELWGQFKMKHSSCKDVYSAYSEALTELASTYNGIATILLVFVGPNCPGNGVNEVRILNTDKEIQGANEGGERNSKKRKHTGSSCEVILQTLKGNYDDEALASIPKPDIVVFFNPGFTCPDYKWTEALDACVQQVTSRRVPFLVTTNTEMEAISDLQFLYQNEYIDELPAIVADIVNGDFASEVEPDIADYNDVNVFFGENPNSGNRVRQSGNMANDLFVKNRWIYGGLFSGRDESTKETAIKKGERDKQSKPKSKRKHNSALM